MLQKPPLRSCFHGIQHRFEQRLCLFFFLNHYINAFFIFSEPSIYGTSNYKTFMFWQRPLGLYIALVHQKSYTLQGKFWLKAFFCSANFTIGKTIYGLPLLFLRFWNHLFFLNLFSFFVYQSLPLKPHLFWGSYLAYHGSFAHL